MRKHKFLYRLLAFVLIGVLLPAVLIFSYFWSRTFEKMNSANAAYYENLVRSFSNNVSEKVQSMESHLSALVVSSKDPKSIFYNGIELLEEAYWRFYLVNSTEYTQSGYELDKFGIYYYDLDTVFFRRATMNAEQYMTVYVDTLNRAELSAYFQSENFRDNSVFYLSVGGAQQDALMIGYNKTVGKNNDRILVFYILDKSGFVQEAKYINGYEDVRFYILDASGENIYLELGRDTLGVSGKWNDILESSHEGVFTQKSEVLPMHFALSVEGDSLKGSITNFYHSMRIILIVCAIVLVCACIVAIYIVYNPIYNLVLGLDWNKDGEIESIRQALDNSADSLSERDVTILDLLLNHLIYGIPIDAKRIELLGIGSEMKYFFAILVDGIVLLNPEMQQLSGLLEKNYSAKILMKEDEEKKESALFLFMKDDRSTEILLFIEQWLKDNLNRTFTLYSGTVVSKINEIRNSFLSCIKARDGSSVDIRKAQDEADRLKKLNERQRNQTDDIIAFIDLHFKEVSFCQTKVADAFDMSNYTLSRLFNNQVGVGFSEYINSKRLEYSKELLRTTDYSIKEISGMSGFSSDTYFYRLFKLTFGFSPSTYRSDRNIE